MNRLVVTSAAAAATLALVLGMAAPASAAPEPPVDVPTTLPAIQAAGERATASRIAAINRLTPTVSARDCVSDDSRATITTHLEAALGGMNDLRARIAAATTVKDAATAYRAVFDDWRVYGVVITQSHLAIAADCLETRALPALRTVQSRLTAALDADPSKATPEIEAAMGELDSHLAAAESAVAGIADAALGVTAADYNADPAVLSDDRLALSTAASEARLAKQAAAEVAKALR